MHIRPGSCTGPLVGPCRPAAGVHTGSARAHGARCARPGSGVHGRAPVARAQPRAGLGAHGPSPARAHTRDRLHRCSECAPPRGPGPCARIRCARPLRPTRIVPGCARRWDRSRRRSEPRPPHHLPALVTNGVLAQLLGVHDLADVLARFEEAAVLDLAVELPDGALARPAEVRVGRRPAEPDRPLQRGSGQPRKSDRDAAARLAHALAAAVGEGDRTASGGHARPSPGPAQGRVERGTLESGAQRRVGADHRLLERHLPRQVDDGPGQAGADHPVDDDDLVVGQRRTVCMHPPAPARSRPAAVAGDLDASSGRPQTDRPCTTAADDVADDGRPVELGHRGPHEQLVAHGGVLRPGALDVAPRRTAVSAPDRSQRCTSSAV